MRIKLDREGKVRRKLSVKPQPSAEQPDAHWADGHVEAVRNAAWEREVAHLKYLEARRKARAFSGIGQRPGPVVVEARREWRRAARRVDDLIRAARQGEQS